MANLLFAGHALGLIVLPLMVFYQIQVMACAALARRYASRPASTVKVGRVSRVGPLPL
jgi:solute carrier family 10 (sodium/bile acid cotransporter), member 7